MTREVWCSYCGERRHPAGQLYCDTCIAEKEDARIEAVQVEKDNVIHDAIRVLVTIAYERVTGLEDAILPENEADTRAALDMIAAWSETAGYAEAEVLKDMNNHERFAILAGWMWSGEMNT